MSLADAEGRWLARSGMVGGCMELVLERIRNWRLISLDEELELIDDYYLGILEAEQIRLDMWQFLDEELEGIFREWWFLDDIGEGRDWGVD